MCFWPGLWPVVFLALGILMPFLKHLSGSQERPWFYAWSVCSFLRLAFGQRQLSTMRAGGRRARRAWRAQRGKFYQGE